jgi:hypothetical protein
MSRGFTAGGVLARILALVAIAAAMTALYTCSQIRHAKAEIDTALRDVGTGLYAVETRRGFDLPPRTITINGADVTLRSTTVAGPLAGALDAAQARCNGADALIDPSLREDDGEVGYVACFDRAAGLGPIDFYRAARRFLDDGDLSGLGAFHYTYARATATGTHLIEARFDGLHLAAMFPASGDAPGDDIDGLPRPQHARRLLSAASPAGDDYHIVVYRIPDAALEATATAYRAAMSAAGWDVRVAPEPGPDREVFYGFQGEALAAVVARPDAGGVLVTIGHGQ